jgi:hypothetical protein
MALSLLLLACAALFAAGVHMAVALQDEASAPLEVGAGPVGEPSLRLVGRALYEPERVMLIGYLTAATNLDVMPAAAPAVANARFTFTGEVTIADRSVRADVRTVAGDGVLRIYLGDGAADWADPASFAAGEVVAEYRLSLRESLQRQDPAVGVVVGDGRLVQQLAAMFALEEEELRFGQSGIASRLRYTGALTAEDSGSVGGTASFLGTVVVTGRAASPVPLGPSAEATP